MSERAIELYKQASEYAYKTVGAEHADKSYFQGVVTGRFAELIVADCVKIIESWAEDDFAINGIAIEILDHFDMELDD